MYGGRRGLGTVVNSDFLHDPRCVSAPFIFARPHRRLIALRGSGCWKGRVFNTHAASVHCLPVRPQTLYTGCLERSPSCVQTSAAWSQGRDLPPIGLLRGIDTRWICQCRCRGSMRRRSANRTRLHQLIWTHDVGPCPSSVGDNTLTQCGPWTALSRVGRMYWPSPASRPASPLSCWVIAGRVTHTAVEWNWNTSIIREQPCIVGQSGLGASPWTPFALLYALMRSSECRTGWTSCAREHSQGSVYHGVLMVRQRPSQVIDGAA